MSARPLSDTAKNHPQHVPTDRMLSLSVHIVIITIFSSSSSSFQTQRQRGLDTLGSGTVGLRGGVGGWGGLLDGLVTVLVGGVEIKVGCHIEKKGLFWGVPMCTHHGQKQATAHNAHPPTHPTNTFPQPHPMTLSMGLEGE